MAYAAEVPANVVVTLDPPEIPFHKTAKLTVEIDAPLGADVVFPDPAALLYENAAQDAPDYQQITADSQSETTIANERKRVTKRYSLDPLNIGPLAVKPVTVTVDGAELTAPVPALRVRDLTEDEATAIKNAGVVPPAPPVAPEPPFPWAMWPWAVAGAVVAAIALIFLVRRARPEGAAAPVTPLTAWERAYERLRELDERDYLKQGLFEPFYVELSAILREYIEGRFAIHAPEQTTPEFLNEAAFSGRLSKEQQDVLSRFLRHCDRVKFAQYAPTEDEMKDSRAVVQQFVEDTVPRAEVSAA